MATSTSYPNPKPKDGSRFLAQATFGPTHAEISRLQSIGYAAWFNEQLGAVPEPHHRAAMDTRLASGAVSLSDSDLMNSFWKQAATAPDQLRQRVAFAFSQIFVVSLLDTTVQNYRRGVASYLDMLGREAFGTYRSLLEAVTRHPMMGIYLTHLKNQKEAVNRIPDQNYAREVMQLFSIGLYELNTDGTLRLVNGRPVETYTHEDIVGLSRVFTGYSWAGPDTLDGRFRGYSSPVPDPDRDIKPMQAYNQFHSVLEKRFLGKVVAANQSNADQDLTLALDTLANHPNVGPFLGKQLIQRLVTSNPSPAYVARVAQAFATGRYLSGTWSVGTGRRGDLRATIAAVLLDKDARATPSLNNPNSGRVREPVLRLANWMRAFGATSTSGRFLLGTTDDPATSLGQSVMRSPSVFNFYRPGYVPPNTAIATAGLVAPEMQIVHETSVIGYSNFMRDAVRYGVGTSTNNLRDIRSTYAAELAIANNPDALVTRLDLVLTFGTLGSATRTLIRDAVAAIPLPATNDAAARLNRVWLAVLFVMSSPNYLVQK